MVKAKTPEQLLAFLKLWLIGLVAVAYLRVSQIDLYELMSREKLPFIECSRRFGKTTSIMCFVVEKLLQNPGWICRWCFPFKNQAREVLIPEMEKLQKGIPDNQKFVYTTVDSVFIHPNGSKIYIRGVNEDRGESARGAASNIIVCDEYGFWVEPEYVVKEVLSPQLLGQEGQWMIKTSTPPRNLGHRYYTEKAIAILKGRFIQKTIYDNESLTKEELDKIIEEAGGVDSPSFKREYLCEPVSDPKSLIVPEFKEEENVVPDDYPRPEFFDAYVGGDSGADDNTAMLFGYYDFRLDEEIIEDEIVISGATTKKIILLSKIKELYLWNNTADLNHVELARIIMNEPEDSELYLTTEKQINELFKDAGKTAWQRVYDAGKQLIFDILGDHKYSIMMPNKADKQAAVHELRVRVGQRKFKLKKRCTQTIWQLKVGMWKDEKRTDFERTEGLGHLDGIAAAIYFNRVVDRSRNPYPQNYGYNRQTQFKSPTPSPAGNSTSTALKKAFGGNRSQFT